MAAHKRRRGGLKLKENYLTHNPIRAELNLNTRYIDRLNKKLDFEEKHGPVKVFTPAEVEAENRLRGLK